VLFDSTTHLTSCTCSRAHSLLGASKAATRVETGGKALAASSDGNLFPLPLSLRISWEQPLLPPPHGALFWRVAPLTPCLGYRSVKQRFLSSPGCHLWQQAKSGESFPLMPTRSEQLFHLLVPPHEASLAATHPVGTGCDPTDKTAVASGSYIVKVLDARSSAQSMPTYHIALSLLSETGQRCAGPYTECSRHNALSVLIPRTATREGRSDRTVEPWGVGSLSLVTTSW